MTATYEFHHFGNAAEQGITFIFPGGEPMVAQSSAHPHFTQLVAAAQAGADDQEIMRLFDLPSAVEERFRRLSERVSARHGRVYFDGDEVANALTAQIVRFLTEGIEDWQPLVAFFEKVQSNPTEHSREQLYEWLTRYDFTITQHGDIVGYKGVMTGDEGRYVSINTGPAIVDGQPVNGHVPNHIGAVVEMPRTNVTHDPRVGCARGLHVGTFDYAKSFARGTVLEVHVNPRDVVSVPTDCEWQKVRCCRYAVIDTIDVPYESPVLDADGVDDDTDWCFACDTPLGECACLYG